MKSAKGRNEMTDTTLNFDQLNDWLASKIKTELADKPDPDWGGVFGMFFAEKDTPIELDEVETLYKEAVEYGLFLCADAPTKVKRVFVDTLTNYDDEPIKGFAYLEDGDKVDDEFIENNWHILLEGDKYCLLLERSEYERDATPEGLKELEGFLFKWIADECGYSKVILEGEG